MDDFLDYAVQWSSVAQAVLVVFAILFGFRQLLQGSRARELQGLQSVFSAMSDPEHKARVGRTLSLQQQHTRWNADDVECVSREVEMFQQLGFFVRHRFLRRRLVLQMYSVLIINMWRAVEQFVLDERARLEAPGFARDFERLAKSSLRYRKRRRLNTGRVLREGGVGSSLGL